ncbi:universal stress protein [Rubripirellula reticaptiva]|uniref:Universal stress protein n=1 Tax=Rubripirellula reticaptiva TaxID=2528013 RepID=A0A5C6EDH7_9BACT|nr:universal stress protein [Rubripirellula reticaptiva]TWU46690.1 Universal stress protein [Rubripirellula reticaptiva]
MRRILLATDGSDSSLNGAKFLAHLPHDETIELTVVSVLFVPGQDKSNLVGDWIATCLEQERTTAKETYAAIEAIFTGADVRLKSIIRKGRPAETIVSISKEIHAEMVVIGATGHSAVTRMLLGSTSDYVATHAPCSVLVVRSTGGLRGKHPLRVAIGYEPSGPAQAAVEEFAEFQWGAQTDVQVVTVNPLYNEREEQRRAEAADLAAEQLLQCAERSTGRVIKNDHVGEGLVKFAEVNDIDLMVVGETPRTRLSRILMGSMTRFVLRHAPCSVWITRNRMIHGFHDKHEITASESASSDS